MVLLLTSGACKDRKAGQENPRLTPEQMVEINRELVIREQERISSYLDRKEIDATLSDRGVWYSILNPADGPTLAEGDRVSLEYTCSLLDGTLCYDSSVDGEMEVVVGRSDIPSGLDSGLRLLARGSEALLIIPSNLAYGLVGDGKRIPSRSALVYYLKVK